MNKYFVITGDSPKAVIDKLNKASKADSRGELYVFSDLSTDTKGLFWITYYLPSL